MGICYYLFRDDNRTAYELGKAYGWGEVFGENPNGYCDTPMTLTSEGRTRERLARAS